MKTLTLILALLASTSLFASSYEVIRVHEDVNYFNHDSFKIDADLYKPTNKPIIATLVLFPTITGVSFLETNTAKYFARHGFVVIVPLPFQGEIDKPNPNIEALDFDFFRPSVAAMKLLEVSDRMFSLNEKLPVFALGASQGGIRSVGLTAFSSRIKAAWFAVAGGDFPYIYAHSQVEALIKFRAQHMKNLGLSSVDDYEKYLRAHLTNDPLEACSKINVPIVQVIALKDIKVPTPTQFELEKACPAHKVYKISAGHVTGSISILLMKDKIKDFFLSQLDN